MLAGDCANLNLYIFLAVTRTSLAVFSSSELLNVDFFAFGLAYDFGRNTRAVYSWFSEFEGAFGRNRQNTVKCDSITYVYVSKVNFKHLTFFNFILAAAVSNLLATLLYKANKLDERLRELIIMRLAWRTGSVYEWTQHWRVAERLKIDGESVVAVRDWQNADCLSAADKAVLAATDETLNDGRISDATWAACCEHLSSEAERIELVLAISNWRLFSEMFQSLRIPLEEGVDHWPPDGLPSPAAE